MLVAVRNFSIFTQNHDFRFGRINCQTSFSALTFNELKSCFSPCVLSAINTVSSAYRMLLIGEPLILIFSVDTILRIMQDK